MKVSDFRRHWRFGFVALSVFYVVTYVWLRSEGYIVARENRGLAVGLQIEARLEPWDNLVVEMASDPGVPAGLKRLATLRRDRYVFLNVLFYPPRAGERSLRRRFS